MFQLQRVNDIILGPITEHQWESRAVFNPATVREGELVHLLYRAVADNNTSTIGYAKTNISGEIVYRLHKPVITRTLNIERQGCEDPRIVPFEDKYYVFYLISIEVEKEFLLHLVYLYVYQLLSDHPLILLQ